MLRNFLALLVCALLAGCGGGNSGGGNGGGGQQQPVTYQLVYPGSASLTSAHEIPVVGLADRNRVASVIIKNGNTETPAVLDSAGRWRAAAVPLDAGDNTLVAELTENNGTVTAATIAIVQSAPVLSYPLAAKVDATNNRVLVLDARQVLTFNVTTGEIAILSSPTAGSGPDFGNTISIVVDSAGGILVSGLRGILRVDPLTGDRTEHVALPAGSGPISTIVLDEARNRLFIVGFFDDLYVADLAATPPIPATTIKPLRPFGVFGGGPTDSVYEPTTDTIYTVSAFSLGVTEIDVNNGDRAPIWLNTGSPPTTSVGIDYDAANSRLLIAGASGSIFSLDPVTRDSSLLLPLSMTSTLPILLRGLSVGTDAYWSVAQMPGELRSIDAVSGRQSVVVSSAFDDGTPPGVMLLGRYDAVADRFIAIADWRVVAIDPSTGSRQQLAELFNALPFPPQDIKIPGAMTLSQNGERVWVADRFDQTVTEIDLQSGATQEVSGPNTGAGPLPDQVSGIDVNLQDSLLYLTDRFVPKVFSLDLATGQRQLVIDLTAELAGARIRAMLLDAAADRLILNVAPLTPASNILPAIHALDLSSLQLSMLANLSSIESPFAAGSAPNYALAQMGLDDTGTSLYIPVSGNADVPFARVDLVSGNVVALGSAATGAPYFVPGVIDVTTDSRLLALDGTSAVFIIDPQTGDRSIITK